MDPAVHDRSTHSLGRQIPRTLDDLLDRWNEVEASDRAMDPDWDIQRISDGDRNEVRIVPKHSYSQQRSPIELDLQFKETEAAKQVQEELDALRDYGTSQHIDVPSEVIENASLSGPAWLGDWSQTDGLTYHGPASIPEIPGMPVTITVTDSDGELLAHRVGKATYGSKGAVGISLEAWFFGALSLRLRLPVTVEAPGFVDTSYDLPGCDARTAERVADLLCLIGQPGNVVSAHLDGNQLFRGSMSSSRQDKMLPAILELAQDLQVIELHTRTSIPFPEEFSQEDRVNVRRIRHMLEGKRSILKTSGFTITPTPDLDPTRLVADQAMLVTWADRSNCSASTSRSRSSSVGTRIPNPRDSRTRWPTSPRRASRDPSASLPLIARPL